MIFIFLYMEINFKPEFDEYFVPQDPINSIFAYIKRRHQEISFPSIGETANDVLYSAFVLSPKHTEQPSIFTKLHQWILVLGSNTIREFIDSIKCPLCELSVVLADQKKMPRKIDTQEQIIYDFSTSFDEKIGTFVKYLNKPITYISTGGCSHVILFVSAFPIYFDSSIPQISYFPVTIGGRGATPPFCALCKSNVGTVAVKHSEESPIEFLCLKCASEIPPENIIKDLNGSFFTYLH